VTYLVYQVKGRDLEFCSEWWTEEEANNERRRRGKDHIVLVNDSGKPLELVYHDLVEESRK
jgi:hypothetical protein